MSIGVIAAHAAISGGSSYDSTVLADSPRAYYPLLTNATDLSGNGRDGTVNGTLTWTGTGPGTAATSASNFTTSNNITLPGTAYASGPFTFEAWIKTTSTTAWAFFLTVNNNQGLCGNDGSTNRAVYVVGAGNNKDGSQSLSNGAWHHYVVTRDGSSNLLMYLDSVQIGSWSSIGAPTATTLHIGCDSSSASPWLGSISRVAIYDTALSAARVSAHYAAV